MPNEAGRELDALIAEKVFGYTPDYEFAALIGAPTIRELRVQYDEWGMLPDYSTDIAAAWKVVDKMHEGIDPAEMGPYQYLTLVCTGAFGERWAASFDFNLSHDWYEADMIVGCPFAARAATPAHAICLAALKAVGVEATE